MQSSVHGKLPAQPLLEQGLMVLTRLAPPSERSLHILRTSLQQHQDLRGTCFSW